MGKNYTLTIGMGERERTVEIVLELVWYHTGLPCCADLLGIITHSGKFAPQSYYVLEINTLRLANLRVVCASLASE